MPQPSSPSPYFQAIRNTQTRFLPALQRLYESAFPAEERREFEQLVQLLKEPHMHLYALVQQDEILGLAVYWTLNDIFFLEHLAVIPHRRNLGLGRFMMDWLLKKAATSQLILEVERPASATAVKRISFYQQFGLVLHPAFDYLQPSYLPHGKQVPLFLMSKPAIASEKELAAIADLIKAQVYEKYYE